jgi:predicted RNA methylase
LDVECYYAAEVDPRAIKVAKRNNPEIVEVGDVTGEG